MPTRFAKFSIRTLIVLISGCAVVHATTVEALAQSAKGRKTENVPPAPVTRPAADALPMPVQEMRDAILAAVRSGRIEDLKSAIDWNELPPAFAKEKTDDPVSFLKRQSADGEGREMLAVIASLFDAGHAVLPVGRDVENSKLFVWPRFAEMPLDKLSPADEVQLYRLVPPAAVKAMRENKRWTWYRLAIGADGTWHSFQKHD